MKKMILKGIITYKTYKEGGISIDDNYKLPAMGYMVAIKGFENLKDMMNTTLASDEFYGTWLDRQDNNKVYYDISKNILDYKEAVDLAKARGELAIYDVQQKCSIYI